MKLRKIGCTATISWSPGAHQPLLVTGTVAGALDASFSTTTELEIWDLDLANPSIPNGGSMKRLAVSKGHVRFNRLAWGRHDSSKPRGIIAGGMEDGHLDLWSPDILLSQSSLQSPQSPSTPQEEPLILQNAAHSGPVRGLDFNPSQSNLLASAATEGEMLIWDLTNPALPFSPGARSPRLEDITALSWNRQLPHILATSSNSGYTVIWDLRNKREVAALRHLGSGPGGIAPVSGLAWNPDVTTQVVTAGDDDISPLILIWDLRNFRAPEKQLMGHTKGILSVSWCPRDSDLLISSAKDNRTLVWNPSSGDVIGELEQSANWAFDVQWCTRNPALVAVASFDGKVTVHSLQSTSDHETPSSKPPSPADPFAPAYQTSDHTSSGSRFHLGQPPKWMKRPVGASWAFGGRLVTFSKSHMAAPLQPGVHRPQPVAIRIVTSDSQFGHRLDELDSVIGNAARKEDFVALCKSRAADATNKDRDIWKYLRLMFESDARELALEYLGFSRKDVGGDNFKELVRKLEISLDDDGLLGLSTKNQAPKIPEQKSVSEPPISADSGTVKEANELSGLFGGVNDDLGIESIEYKSAISATPFKLYSSTVSCKDEEVDVDNLISRAVILGNYSVAVQACMAVNRYADAMVLAVCGGPDLVAKARDVYFACTRDSKSYMRVLQGVSSGKLNDIVENAELGESVNDAGWKELLALICIYAKPEEFATLFGILGSRLEGIYMYSGRDTSSTMPKNVPDGIQRERASAAVLCYLSAGNLPRLVEIWASSMAEEEREYLADPNSSKSSAHLAALQSFIEKVTIYRRATSFVDVEFTIELAVYKLSSLYNLYGDFAEQAASQGRLNLAWKFLSLIPEGFTNHSKRQTNNHVHYLKDRLYRSGALSSNLEAQDPKIPYIVNDRASGVKANYNADIYTSNSAINNASDFYAVNGQQQQQYYNSNMGYNSISSNAYGYNTNMTASTIPQQQQGWAPPAITSKPLYYGQVQTPAQPIESVQPMQLIQQHPQYGYSQSPLNATMAQPPPPVNSTYQQAPLPPSAQNTAPVSGFNDLPPGFVSADSRRSTPKPVFGYTPGFGQQPGQMISGQQISRPTTQQPWNAANQPFPLQPPPIVNSKMAPPPPTMNAPPLMNNMNQMAPLPPPTMNAPSHMNNINQMAPPPPTMNAPPLMNNMNQMAPPSAMIQQPMQQQLPPPPISKPPTPAPTMQGPPPTTSGMAFQPPSMGTSPLLRKPTPPIVSAPSKMHAQQQYSNNPLPTNNPRILPPPSSMGLQQSFGVQPPLRQQHSRPPSRASTTGSSVPQGQPQSAPPSSAGSDVMGPPPTSSMRPSTVTPGQGIAPSSAMSSPAPLRAAQPTPPPPTAPNRYSSGDR